MIKETNDGFFEVCIDGELIARVPYEGDAVRILKAAQELPDFVERLKRQFEAGEFKELRNVEIVSGTQIKILNA